MMVLGTQRRIERRALNWVSREGVWWELLPFEMDIIWVPLPLGYLVI
jgi:hypothetical protein